MANIDPRALFLSVTNDELRRGYAEPPPRSTLVVDVEGETVATTMEPSGFDGAPVVVRQIEIDRLKDRIAP